MKNYKRNILLYDHFCDPGHEMSHCEVQIFFHVKTDDDDTKDVTGQGGVLHADALYSLPVWGEW